MPYDNSARAAAARRTRGRVVTAAHEHLLAHGWAGTTIRAVAQAAGVSPETVYKAFGGKAGLLKAVYDQVIAGDDDAVPLRDRPLFRPLVLADTAARAARAYADIAAHFADRAGPLLRVALSSRGADPDVRAFAEQIRAERLTGVRMVLAQWQQRGWLRQDRTLGDAVDVTWTLISPEVHELLHSRGWATDRYRDWLVDALLRTVLLEA